MSVVRCKSVDRRDDRVLRDVIGILSYEFPDGSTDESATPAVLSTAGRSVLAAPLVAFNKLLGAIVLEKDGTDEPFDEGHLRLLMTIAPALRRRRSSTRVRWTRWRAPIACSWRR